MSQTFGPYNSSSTPSISAGTVTGISVNQDAAAVRISNQSLTNDLLVSFAASQPPTVTTVGGGPNWPVVLHPGDRITCTLQNADKTPTALGQFWAGKVWLLPLSTSSQLAQSGTTPSLSNIWISTYAAGEPIPPTDPGPLATANTSQQRVVAVPIVAVQNFALRVTLAVGVLAKYAVETPTAAQLAAKQAVFYLYWSEMTLSGIGANSITGWSINIEAYPGDATNNPIAGFTPIVLYVTDLYGSHNGTNAVYQSRAIFAPAQPVLVVVNWNGLGTPAKLCLRVNCAGGTGTAALAYTIAGDYDTTNVNSAPGNIGNAALYTVGSNGDPHIY